MHKLFCDCFTGINHYCGSEEITQQFHTVSKGCNVQDYKIAITVSNCFTTPCFRKKTLWHLAIS